MKIKLWFFGKKNEITDFEREMSRRIGFRADFEMIPLPQAGIVDANVAKRAESEKFLSKISDQDFVVAFDEHGSRMDSVKFATQLKNWLVDCGTVHFVIGGAHGLDEKMWERADEKVSFGKMVWTRNLVRSMACEQLYRAMEIDGGSHFHKS